MKIIVSFLSFAFFMTFNSSAQSIVDTNKVWYNVELGYDGIFKTSIFSFKGDTTIDGKKYKKVVLNDSSSTVFDFPIAVREDTTTKRVYFYYPGEEYLAYDFSLKVDSFFMTYNDGCVVQYVVDAIDSVTLLNGEKRMRITLQGSPASEQWIEGIGSDLGLFRMGMYCCDHEYRISRLNCFKENGILKYHNTNYSSCYYTTIGIKENNESNKILIFPNPAFTSLFFTEIPPGSVAEILSISGQLICQSIMNKPQLDISNLAKGLYFVKLTSEDGSVVRKFVKE